MGLQKTLKLRIREKGTGRRVEVTIRPDMTPEEVAEEVRRQLGTNEPVVFWLRRHDGVERPIPAPDPTYLREIAVSGAEILVERRRMYGADFEKHIAELLDRYPFRYDPLFNGYVLEMYSIIDGKEYRVVIYRPETSYPEDPPKVYITPYPEYVRRMERYERNHASSCCWPRESVAGRYCFLHIDSGAWNKARSKPNPLLWIMENIVQGLDLSPLTAY